MAAALRRWLRAASARLGIRVPFPGVICVSGAQSIDIDREGRAHISTKRQLVFLETPEAGDLEDTYALGTGEPASAVIDMSADAIELSREEREPGRITVAWLPRDSVSLYSIYEHQNAWTPSTAFNGTTICLDYECDMRTGAFTIELAASTFLEGAVLIPRPRWPLRLSERVLVRMALQELKMPSLSPTISSDGMRVTYDIPSPRVGDRYVLVAFRRCGVADCEQWLQQTSVAGRMQRALTDWARASDLPVPESWHQTVPYREAKRSPLVIPWPSVSIRD